MKTEMRFIRRPGAALSAAVGLALAAIATHPAMAEDAYVESLKANTIFTDYYAKPTTRIDLDFEWLAGTYGDASVAHGGMVIGPWNSGCGTATAFWNAGGADGMQFIVGSDRKTVNSGRIISAARWFLSIDGHTGNLKVAQHGAATTNVVTSGAKFEANAKWPVSLLGASKSTDGSAVDGGQFAKARIYGCKIYEWNETSGDYDLVRDYVPVLRDGQPCLRDAVTGAFALDPRKGAAALRYGGNIEEVGGGYIQLSATSGAVGLFTGYKMKATSRVELDGALGSASGTFRPMGCWNGGGSTTMRYLVYTASNKNQFFLNSGSSQGSGPAIDTDRHTWVFDAANNKGEYITGCTPVTTITGTKPAVDAVASVQLSIFADSNGSAFSQPAYGMKCYGLKIYESGVLVTNFVPYVRNGEAGFRDTITGAFLSAGTSSFAAGGNIELSGPTARDAYIENDGTTILDLDYKASMKTRVEYDFQNLLLGSDRVFFGAWSTGSGNLKYCCWNSGGKIKFIFAGNGAGTQNSTTIDTDYGRHTAIMDMKNKALAFVTDGVTNNITVVGAFNDSDESSQNMGAFAALTGNMVSQSRIYAVRIYEDNTLKHEFLPYKNGTTVSLYDTKTGNVATRVNDSMAWPIIGGMGVDGAEKWLVEPAAATAVPADGSATVTAKACGKVVRYIWTLGGETLADTDDSIAVLWRSGTSGLPVAGTVTPIYEVFGNEVTGAPVAFNVTFNPKAFVMVVR